MKKLFSFNQSKFDGFPCYTTSGQLRRKALLFRLITSIISKQSAVPEVEFSHYLNFEGTLYNNNTFMMHILHIASINICVTILYPILVTFFFLCYFNSLTPINNKKRFIKKPYKNFNFIFNSYLPNSILGVLYISVKLSVQGSINGGERRLIKK